MNLAKSLALALGSFDSNAEFGGEPAVALGVSNGAIPSQTRRPQVGPSGLEFPLEIFDRKIVGTGTGYIHDSLSNSEANANDSSLGFARRLS